MQALANGGVVPSKTATYSLSSIQNALSRTFGSQANIAIACRNKTDVQYLFAIDMCLDLNYNAGSCLCPKKTTCSSTK